MPENLTPQNQWETEFQVPLPGEPRNIGSLRTLFQRLLNRTERLRARLADILGTAWDANPPATINNLHSRVSTLEGNQGGTTLAAHRSAATLDHPDGSVTTAKLANEAVTEAKLANGAVTGAKLAPGAALENIGVLATAPSATGTTLLYNGRELGIVGDTTEAKWILHTGDYSLNLHSDHSNTINLGNAITLQGRTYRRKVQFTPSGEILGRYDHQWRFPISLGGMFPSGTTIGPNNYFFLSSYRIFVPGGWTLVLRRARYYAPPFFGGVLRVSILGPNGSWTSSNPGGETTPNTTLASSAGEILIGVSIFNSSSSNINISTSDNFGIWLELELRPL